MADTGDREIGEKNEGGAERKENLKVEEERSKMDGMKESKMTEEKTEEENEELGERKKNDEKEDNKRENEDTVKAKNGEENDIVDKITKESDSVEDDNKTETAAASSSSVDEPPDPQNIQERSPKQQDAFLRQREGETGGQERRDRCYCERSPLCVAGIVFVVLLAVIIGIVLIIELLRLYNNSNSYIQTPMGQIRGSIVASPGGNDVEEYLGIPYAKPPVGELRFADPVAIKKFTSEPLEANKHKASCMQAPDLTQGDFWGTMMWNPPGNISEDCLYLNVWSPTPRQEKKRPVMLWIFGGGYTSGTSSLAVYDGKILAAHGDVVVVSFDYRVGALGYLATGDGRIKGNFGSKDQAMVIKWVHENIAAFGGDPDQVTLFGESAGGASVGYSMLSPMTRDLFQRAIVASASPNSHWAYMTPAEAQTRSNDFITAVSCSNSPNLMKCLRSIDAETIIGKQWPYGEFLLFPFVPVIDGEYLTDTPYNLVKNRTVPKKDILIGSNKDEGSFWLLYYLSSVSAKDESLHIYQQFLDGVDIIAYDLSQSNRERAIELYTSEQIKDTSNIAANRDAVDRIVGDRSFTCPPWDLAHDLANQSQNVWYYYLTYRASNEVWPQWMGVIHGADCQWMFGQALAEQTKQENFSDGDKQFAREIMSYISNFAKTGDPNGRVLPMWSKFQAPEFKYQEWRGPNDFRTNTTFREPFCEFWRELNKDWFEGRQIR